MVLLLEWSYMCLEETYFINKGVYSCIIRYRIPPLACDLKNKRERERERERNWSQNDSITILSKA